MQELITITTDGQGSSVVSARELYVFLGVKQQFTDWIKKRIIKYGFQKDTDFVELEGFSSSYEKPVDADSEGVLLKSEKNPKGGRPQTDYALTLDMAKQLAMVENNDKGNEARRYFINCERAAHELAKRQLTPPAPPSPTEQMILTLMQQQAQLMSGQQLLLEQLRADVNAIQAGQRPTSRNPRPTAARHTPALPAQQPARSLRQQFTDKVNEYCARYDVYFDDAYRHMYNRLYKDFNFNVNHYRFGNEKPLDTVERYGKLMWLISIVDSELAYQE